MTAFFNRFATALAQSLTRTAAADVRLVTAMWLRALQLECGSSVRDLVQDWALVEEDATELPRSVHLDRVLEEIRRDRHNLQVVVPFDYVLSLAEIAPELLCNSCHCPGFLAKRELRNILTGVLCAQLWSPLSRCATAECIAESALPWSTASWC